MIGVPDERLGEVVLAVVEVKPGESLTVAELEKYREKNLPRCNRPRCFIFDKVPSNPTGGIEKPKLREKYRQVVFS